MAGKRAIGRDVHFYNFSEPDKALGGLILNPSVTQKTFLSMLGNLIVASGPYRVTLRSTGHDLTPTDERLQPGHYDIRPYSRKDTITIADEPCILRIISRSSTGRDSTFRTQVRERDGKCVITGTVNRRADRDNWSSFHAAHIFPLSSEDYFVQSGFSRLITNKGVRDTGINSCQNGLLMRSHMHEQFDGYYFSINPDDGYKITCFDEDFDKIDGRILDPVCRDRSDSRRVSDELLRWHFREAVLANMRGAGEPKFETDFPPGTDMVGEILSGPTAAKRMEAELFSRLGGFLAWDSHQMPTGQS
ncbi:HNH endonuclease-domain-containing protein [Lipomyces kononenkoae]|uniref:HNH endonuclease-domain-containing protein n=1 Tax=Lipomyces kononenkoae TaxID=34357 RepID=A0ACC3SYX5_LIPKO